MKCKEVLKLLKISRMTLHNYVVNGKPIKSINQFYNKKKSKLQSELETKNKTKTSKRIQNLSLKRTNKINDCFHKTSRYIFNQLVSHSINTLVIGNNNGWKQETNIGAVNNQKFVSIPHDRFIDMLKYKCHLEGINVIVTEESYTSKASFFDNDYIPTYSKDDDKFSPSGRRVNRGLYKTKDGMFVNADVNGSLNILRKQLNVVCDDIICPADIWFVMNPLKIIFFHKLKQNKL